eukprot:scaffold111208_cov39-Phaeocystis_antarctica.AAC.1
MQPTAKGVYPDAVVHLDHNAGTQDASNTCPMPNALFPIQCPIPSAQYLMRSMECTTGTKTRIWTMARAAAELLSTTTTTTTTTAATPTTAATTTAAAAATAAALLSAAATHRTAGDALTNRTSGLATWLPLLRGPRKALSYARRQQVVV